MWTGRVSIVNSAGEPETETTAYSKRQRSTAEEVRGNCKSPRKDTAILCTLFSRDQRELEVPLTSSDSSLRPRTSTTIPQRARPSDVMCLRVWSSARNGNPARLPGLDIDFSPVKGCTSFHRLSPLLLPFDQYGRQGSHGLCCRSWKVHG